MDNDIQQYVLLSKSARGLALVDLVQKATSDPAVFAFGELLDMPDIQALRHGEHNATYELLELFAYGTWADYQAQSSTIKLNEQQQLKLKQLTVVSLAQHSKTIPYAVLMKELGISNMRALEDLLISDCFYTRLTTGKLDQHQGCLHVQEARSRDIRGNELGPVVAGLTTWLQTAQQVLTTIEERIQWAASASEAAEKSQQELEAHVEEVKKSLKQELERGSQEGMLIDDFGGSIEMMDEDRTGGRPKRRR